jgi:hypothetical protein
MRQKFFNGSFCCDDERATSERTQKKTWINIMLDDHMAVRLKQGCRPERGKQNIEGIARWSARLPLSFRLRGSVHYRCRLYAETDPILGADFWALGCNGARAVRGSICMQRCGEGVEGLGHFRIERLTAGVGGWKSAQRKVQQNCQRARRVFVLSQTGRPAKRCHQPRCTP